MSQTHQKIRQALKALNFTEKETSVYLALLELGKGTVSVISRKAGINRTTGYEVLDSLVSKGVASILGKEPKQEYAAESPDIIAAIASERYQKAKQELQTAASLVPNLKSMHNTTGRPNVRFYEGKHGLRAVYEDTLTATEPIRAYATIDDMHQALPNYFPEYYRR